MKSHWLLSKHGPILTAALSVALGGWQATAAPAEPQADTGNWKQELSQMALEGVRQVEEFADARWRSFSEKLGLNEPRHIVAYRGYGNEQSVWVRGRLLANDPPKGPREDDDWWDNLRATYARWETREVPGADIELSYGNLRRTVTTDEEGYYTAQFDRGQRHTQSDIVTARYSDEKVSIDATHPLTLPGDKAQYMVISDMDDTVIHTGITDLKVAAKLTFLHNAKTRKPLAGVAGLYRALAGGDDAHNPIFYVSNSGWNMYDLLRDFIQLNAIPRGPLLLRDLGFHSEEESTEAHKAQTIRKLLDRYPHLPAVFIGDSGQHDAELYAEVARDYADRILAIYIRDVDPDQVSAFDAKADKIIEDNAGSRVPMLRGADSGVFAQHLRELGILEPAEQRAVANSVERDRQREETAGK